MRAAESGSAVRIDRLVTSGTFSLDGGTWDLQNNVWIVGNDAECIVIDAAHDADAIAAGIGGRSVRAILLTHGHNDHIGAAEELAATVQAPVYLHPEDRMLWDRVFPGRGPDRETADGEVFEVAGSRLTAIHTPGHTPGSTCFHLAPSRLESAGTVFSGDTLFHGGPGATGRSFSDFPTIIQSITDRLLTLPPDTVVRTGHGESTSIGDEAPHLQEWIDRGY